MALQKNELILFIIITLLSFVLCYSSLHENQLIDKYVDEASEFDSKAYPSYFNTIDDGSNLFKGLIKESADVLCLKSFHKVDTSTSSSAEMVGVNDFGAEGDGETDDTKVFCLEHRSYIKHNCPKGDRKNVTVVICPLCAKGVHLIPDEDPNITWERHVNTDCDPSNYEKATKKKKCPVPGCKEILTFSNTIKCRDCTVDHCLKHRFGLDHKCPGPKKPEAGFPFLGYLSRSRKEVSKPNHASAASSPNWSSFLTAASSFRASAEASVAKLSSELSQKWQIAKDGTGQSSSSSESRNGQGEVCPQCGAEFSTVTTLVDHVEKVHEKGGNRAAVVKKVTIDACPKCSKGFRDPVALVEHVERDHGGTSRA